VVSLRLVVTGGSLIWRPKRFLRCLLVEVPWQINEYLNPNLNLIIKIIKRADPRPKQKALRSYSKSKLELESKLSQILPANYTSLSIVLLQFNLTKLKLDYLKYGIMHEKERYSAIRAGDVVAFSSKKFF